MSEEINYMDFQEFWEAGYLQEVNRLFFHPLGLALEVQMEDGKAVGLGGIWDYRDDPEGMNFYDPPDLEKAKRIDAEAIAKKIYRLENLGYFIQPPGEENE